MLHGQKNINIFEDPSTTCRSPPYD